MQSQSILTPTTQFKLAQLKKNNQQLKFKFSILKKVQNQANRYYFQEQTKGELNCKVILISLNICRIIRFHILSFKLLAYLRKQIGIEMYEQNQQSNIKLQLKFYQYLITKLNLSIIRDIVKHTQQMLQYYYQPLKQHLKILLLVNFLNFSTLAAFKTSDLFNLRYLTKEILSFSFFDTVDLDYNGKISSIKFVAIRFMKPLLYRKALINLRQMLINKQN
ncbi:unnamed protein product [Paramecium sonneborni]|uniref:Uncharacterized protein n=1 Tax=Paramecium sonneborni TaxID=65129 RepID=A0A8S1L622_9CILI|nr:unnamed protein product [Paramecium sonneborni]